MTNAQILTLLWNLAVLHRMTFSHLTLTFPPARRPQLDHILLPATGYGCGGIPIDPNSKTILPSGSNVDIKWSPPFGILETFRIELLDTLGVVLYVLTPNNETFTEANDRDASYRVHLPDISCINCTLRLLKQASDNSASIRLLSCADIDIIKIESACSAGGSLINGTCQCKELHSGSMCQYKDDCDRDEHCGSKMRGSCVRLYCPNRQCRTCYCKPGRRGIICEKESPIEVNTAFVPSLYNRADLNDNNAELFWRRVKSTSDIEFVFTYPRNNWLAIGLKSNKPDAQCNDILTRLSAESQSFVGSQKNIEITSKLPDSVQIFHSTTNMPNSLEPSVSSEITQEQRVDVTTEPKEPISENEAASTSMPTRLSVGQSSVQDLMIVSSSLTVHEPTTSLRKTEELYEDVTDEIKRLEIVNGTSQSRSGSLDKMNFVSSSTYFQPSTVSVENDDEYDDTTDEIIKLDAASENNKSFTVSGKKQEASNDIPLNNATNNCYGDWRWPKNCHDCDYVLFWSYAEDMDEIEFSLEAKIEAKSWTGIGFSKDLTSQDSDFIIIRVWNETKIDLLDAHSVKKTSLRVDAVQNLRATALNGSLFNGILRTSFNRGRKTNDPEHDAQFTDQDCFYFLFPAKAIPLNDSANDETLDYPIGLKISDNKNCIGACAQEMRVSSSDSVATGNITCNKEYKFPADCVYPDCEYYATWYYNKDKDAVNFQLLSSQLGKWTGIGFSKDGNMHDSDMVIGWVFNNKTVLTDRFVHSSQEPVTDENQNLFDIKGESDDENDRQIIWFSRKIVTEDSKEDISLKDCIYFLFPVGGDRILAKNEADFGDPLTPLSFKELTTPRRSSSRTCICDENGLPADDGKKNNRIRREIAGILTQKSIKTGILETEHHRVYRKANTTVRSDFLNDVSTECTDVIVCQTTNNLSKITHYYAVGLSSPLQLESLGLESRYGLISPIFAKEQASSNELRYRIKISSAQDSAGFSSSDSLVIVWAYGEDSDHLWSPLFYPTNVTSRGVTIIDLSQKSFSDNKCKGIENYPYDCQNANNCKYKLIWSQEDDALHFVLEARILRNMWTGIGFSRNGQLANADLIIAQLNPSGPVEVTDRHLGRLTAISPAIDHDQNIVDVDARYIDGLLRVVFTRPLISDSKFLTAESREEDLDLMSGCFFLLYPYDGGLVDANGQIIHHGAEWNGSRQKVCLDSCNTALHEEPTRASVKPVTFTSASRSSKITMPPTNEKRYTVGLKIKMGDLTSTKAEFSDERMSRLVSDYVIKAMFDVNPGSQRIESLRLRREKDAMLATVKVAAQGIEGNYLRDSLIYNAKKSALNGGIVIDPDSITVENEKKERDNGAILSYIIVAVSSLIIVLIFLGCSIFCLWSRWKRSRTRTTLKRYQPDKTYPVFRPQGNKSRHERNGPQRDSKYQNAIDANVIANKVVYLTPRLRKQQQKPHQFYSKGQPFTVFNATSNGPCQKRQNNLDSRYRAYDPAYGNYNSGPRYYRTQPPPYTERHVDPEAAKYEQTSPFGQWDGFNSSSKRPKPHRYLEYDYY